MKLKYFFLIISSFLFFISCSKTKICSGKEINKDTNFVNEKISLAEFVYKTGNIIDKKQCPYLVHAQDIYYNKNDYLLIDIRDSSEYVKGHIDGAYNVKRKDIMQFLEDSIKPAAYKKIAIIDDQGPLSEYIAMLLRFDGYNAYGLKFGIASWNRKFVANINKYLSDKYANRLDTTAIQKPAHGQIPSLSSDNIVKFLDSRVSRLISEPQSNIFVSADQVFKNLNKYFKLAYWSEEKYSKAHIPGSVRYQTRQDLSINSDLNTLPTNKPIVVYCNTGHHAIAIVAYLRLLGYNAKSIMYGVNSFMNKKLKQFAPGAAILDGNVLCSDYPLISGKNRTAATNSNKKIASTTPQPTPIMIKHRKTQTNVGGCE